MKTNQTQGGFIGRIILLIVAVIALKYFLNFDIIAWIRSPEVWDRIKPLFSIVIQLYNWLDETIRSLAGK